MHSSLALQSLDIGILQQQRVQRHLRWDPTFLHDYHILSSYSLTVAVSFTHPTPSISPSPPPKMYLQEHSTFWIGSASRRSTFSSTTSRSNPSPHSPLLVYYSCLLVWWAPSQTVYDFSCPQCFYVFSLYSIILCCCEIASATIPTYIYALIGSFRLFCLSTFFPDYSTTFPPFFVLFANIHFRDFFNFFKNVPNESFFFPNRYENNHEYFHNLAEKSPLIRNSIFTLLFCFSSIFKIWRFAYIQPMSTSL